MTECREIYSCLIIQENSMRSVALPRLDHGSRFEGQCLDLPCCLVVCWAWLVSDLLVVGPDNAPAAAASAACCSSSFLKEQLHLGRLTSAPVTRKHQSTSANLTYKRSIECMQVLAALQIYTTANPRVQCCPLPARVAWICEKLSSALPHRTKARMPAAAESCCQCMLGCTCTQAVTAHCDGVRMPYGMHACWLHLL
jgi:hypothetical protein